MALSIGSSVGKKNNGAADCYNVPKDQSVVITLLNSIDASQGGTKQTPLKNDPKWGVCSQELYQAILNFQKKQKGLSVDGHVDPGGNMIGKLNELAGANAAPAPGVKGSTPAVAAPKATVEPDFPAPYDTLPQALKDTIRRTHKEKTEANDNFAWELGFKKSHIKLTLPELLKKLEDNGHLAVLKDVYKRCEKFSGLWGRIRCIFGIWTYAAGNEISQGFHFSCDDPDAFLKAMQTETKKPKETFCQDDASFTAHGDRDCFREIITSGPGLHVCVTRTASRPVTPYEIHIDKFQQVCTCKEDGQCNYKYLNENSLKHMWDATPWWLGQKKQEVEQKVEDGIKKVLSGAPRLGQKGPW
jgi:hypothetical protein